MICSHDECDNEFNPKTHNQKYCSDECCKIATNLKIKQKYQDEKNRKKGVKRYCRTGGCKNELSRYNEDNVCSQCKSKKESSRKKVVQELMRNVLG